MDPEVAAKMKVGTRLADRYEVLDVLGRGGMGVVYRALDPRLGREVAVKLVPPALLTPEAEERFRREAQVVARMDHPAIVPVHDIGRHEDSLFLVMPLLEGTNLRTLLSERALKLPEILVVGIQVAEALEYSHARGVVHRDVKPENVMVTGDEQGRLRARVMDFGLARTSTDPRLTASGAIVGTLAYLSPEQVSSKEVDQRTDVYSLGTVLYECLAGEPPFAGETGALLYRIVHENPPAPSLAKPGLDDELEQVVLGCLAKEPARRPQSAGELAEALRRCLSRLGPSAPAPEEARAPLAPRPPRTAFVGRAAELRELVDRLDRAGAGESQLVLVAGEPGVGKSRLLQELEVSARARGVRVLRGRFIEHDRSFPYQGYCEAIQEHFRRPEADTPPGSLDFSDLAAGLVSLFPVLSEIGEMRALSGSAPDALRPHALPADRSEIFELLARSLIRIAGGRPLVLLLEDLHEADVSIEALQYVVRRLGPARVLIAGTYRSTEVDKRHPIRRLLEDFAGDRRFAQVPLTPLLGDDFAAYLRTLFGGSEPSAGLVERLFEATEGNPFFAKELVRSLLDGGSVVRDAKGAWSLSGEAALTGALPPTIQQAVERRIEHLPDPLREVLATASVVGRTFDVRDLEPIEGTDLEEALERLAGEGLIEEEAGSRGQRLAFVSGVVRDVLYASLSRRKRRSIHRRHAERLEKRHAGRLERVFQQLLHHFSQGDMADKAVEYGMLAARKSLAAFSPEDAIRELRTVLEFLDEEWEGDPTLEGEARVLLASADRLAGNVEGAIQEAERAVRVFEERSQPARAASAMRLLAETAWQGRRIEETRRWLERGIEAARAASETDCLWGLLSLAATVANLRGEYQKGNEYLEEAQRLAGPERRERRREAPRGGRLTAALANPVRAREPAEMEVHEEAEVLANVFETLLATDAHGNLQASLCERWESRDGGRSFLLTLRRGVRFSDGQPLDASSVKASFERAMRRAGSEKRAAFAAIEGVAEAGGGPGGVAAGVVVRSEHELEIRLHEPLPIYPALLTDGYTAIVREPSAPGGVGLPVVGTGPFLCVSHAPERVVLESRADHWSGSSAPLDGLEFRASLNSSAIAAGFRAGEFDLVRDLPPAELEEMLRQKHLRTGLIEAPKKTTWFALFHASSPLGGRAALRQALAGLVRPNDLVWRSLGRFALPAAGLLPPGILGHDPGRRRPAIGRERALEILAADGLALPLRLRASIHPVLLDRYAALAAALFGLWSELGVEVQNATPTLESFLAAREASEGIDLRIGRWNADYDDPDNFTYGLFHSRNGLFRRYFSSGEADRLMEEARTEPRPEAREALYHRFESLILDSALLIPLFHEIDCRLASPAVRGLRLRSTAPFVNYAELGKAATAAAGVERRREGGGVLQVPIATDVATLDPPQGFTVGQGEMVPSVFETLTRDRAGQIVPWLAAEVQAEQGGRRFRFRLRDDVRFHDDRRLTARDVRFSFERLLQDRRSQYRWTLTPIRGARELAEGSAQSLEGFRILSGAEFVIELDSPVSFFTALLSHQTTSIVPEGSDRLEGSWKDGCVGTGAFRVVRFVPGQRLELEPNPHYWREGYPKSDGLVFRFGLGPAEILSEFRSGGLSLASDLLPADVEALLRDPEYASGYRETPRLSTYFVAFNAHRGPLADLRLRRRLVEAVDVDALVRRTMGRLAVPAHGLIAPGLLGYEPKERRATLSGVSATAGEAPPLTAAVNPVYFGEYGGLLEGLMAGWRGEGLPVEFTRQGQAEYTEIRLTGAADMIVTRWFADYPDADSFVHGLLDSKAGTVGRFCSSGEIDRLIERSRRETEPALRHSICREIEERIAREALLLPLFHEQVYRFCRPEVAGFQISFSVPTARYEELWVRR